MLNISQDEVSGIKYFPLDFKRDARAWPTQVRFVFENKLQRSCRTVIWRCTTPRGAPRKMSESNRLLDSLTMKDRKEVLKRSIHVELEAKELVSDAGTRPQHAYFMLSALASEVVGLADGELVEIGLVGFEGVTGTFHLLGKSASVSQCLIQIAGSAYRISLRDLEQLFVNSEGVRKGILQYVQHQMAHLGQTAACNRMHDAGPRFARWLLTVQDRSARDEFLLTQQFLAHILGTGRTTINVLARHFERQALIGHNRGKIRILDREGLESVACACYEATRNTLIELYG
ncbi:MAG: Crp/Fnr family transcriptional regulator [Janthinobacterium lividum]